jgi:hypothetical protein
MPESYRISCIQRSGGTEAHDRIRFVGGQMPGGRRWKLSQFEAIAGMEGGRWQFSVEPGGRGTRVVIARSASGRKYLKTAADGEQPDGLLALPECL